MTIRKLLPHASLENPLAFMVYSGGSIECNAALKEYIDAHPNKEQAFNQLRCEVTIVTIGAATGG